MKRLAIFAAAALISAAAAFSAQAANDGKNRRVVVENLSTIAVNELYASPVTSDSWEEDLLGSETIPSGTSRGAVIDNGTNECQYDLKIVMADRKEYVHRNVNVCAVSWWVIGDAGDTIH
ncbi:MAG: hypothetical protein K1X35_10850 [Caulobacteraceae bacterium]|nr:hypothetical protein [Caulobacteraceae bacterium]